MRLGWPWRRKRDKEAFARFMCEWAEAQESTLRPLAVDLSPPQPLSEAEGLSEASDASDGLLEGKNGHSRKWPDSHLRAHGLLRKDD